MSGSLAGIRVIDCTHVIAGAYCSMTLADLGADVIKIEPLKGEVTRGHPKSKFSAFDFVNRNKRTIAVNLAAEQGQAVIKKLVGQADVFVENFRPGAMQKLGLDYESLAKINPGLVYCSVSGFGQNGPYRDRGGFDLIAQGMSGIMSFTGQVGTNTPTAAGVPLSDLNAGLFAAVAVLSALRHKAETGEGQHVETSLLESALAYTIWESGMYLTTGQIAEPRGSRHMLAAPYEALKTGDGYMVVGVNNDSLWRRFCKALDIPNIEADARFATARDRVKNRDALQEVLEEFFSAKPTDYWLSKLETQGVPAGPINNISEAWDDPHIKARGLLQEVDDRQFVRAPIQMSKTPVRIGKGVSDIGADTAEVLAEFGYSASEIQRLTSADVIGQTSLPNNKDKDRT